MRYYGLLLLAFAATALNAKTLFRYVDEQGQIVLKDSLPPSIAPKGYSILNEKGKVVQVVPPAKTPEQIAIETAKEQAAQRLKAEQQRVNDEENTIRATFSSIEDIVRARDSQVAALEVQVGIIQSSLSRLNEDLKGWQRQAAGYERSAKAIPDALKNSTNSTLAQIENSEADIKVKREEQQQITTKFNTILHQYQLMVSRDAVQLWQNKNAITDILALACADASQCQQWFTQIGTELAQQKALSSVEIRDNKLLLTHLPQQDNQLAYWLAIVDDRQSLKPHIAFRLFCRESPGGRTLCSSSDAEAAKQSFRKVTGAR